jgi:hypothetical protein
VSAVISNVGLLLLPQELCSQANNLQVYRYVRLLALIDVGKLATRVKLTR